MCNCLGKCVLKIVLTVFNGIILLVGIALGVAGGFLIWGQAYWQYFLEEYLKPLLNLGLNVDWTDNVNAVPVFQQIGYVSFGVGIVLFIIGVAGCFGALCGWVCFLKIYTGLLGLLNLAVVTFAILYFTPLFDMIVESLLKEAVKVLYADIWQMLRVFNLPAFMWNMLMINMKCCGVTNSNDYLSAEKWNRTFTLNNSSLAQVPVACCKFVDGAKLEDIIVNSINLLNDKNCPFAPTENNSYISRPCYTEVRSVLNNNIIWVILFFVALFLVIMIPTVVTGWLIKLLTARNWVAPDPQDVPMYPYPPPPQGYPQGPYYGNPNENRK